jgi:geranylgeranylglycerol-phosphate geranylgeranyltransferase
VQSIKAWLTLARWPNVLIAAAGVFVGAWWARGDIGGPVLWAAVAAIFITTAANAWNDLADVEIDRVAHPERPLPSGAIEPRQASVVAWMAAAAGVAASWRALPVLGGLTAMVLAIAWPYSPYLKRIGLLGNAVVAVIASLPFLYGAWAAGAPGRGLALVAIAVPLHFAREVAKDLNDMAGDASSRRTIPLRHGTGFARLVIVVASLAFVAALAWPAFRAPLFALALVPAVALSMAGVGAVVRGARAGPALFKAAMVCALLAVIVARP